MTTNQAELAYSLALADATRTCLNKQADITSSFNSFAEIFAADDASLKSFGLSTAAIKKLRLPDQSAIDHALTWAEQPNHYIVSIYDRAYPQLLREIPSAPCLLYVKGDVSQLSSVQIGMVGSRHPSPAGSDTAIAFAKELAHQGLTITSGLAMGVDSLCHEGALQAKGKTIAVLGTGVDQVYPKRNEELAEQIMASGAIVSEYPLGTLPHPGNFPQRNRIISGLSVGVIVVEAAVKSGSLISARFANEQGRDVFAIPGSIHNPMARGCHHLIKQGAKLVETSGDILEELGSLLNINAAQAHDYKDKPKLELDADHQKIVQCLDFETTSIDQVIARSGLATQQVSSILLHLELKGAVKSVPGGYMRAIK